MKTIKTATSLRATVSGTLTRAELRRLLWPIAWNGTASDSDRREQERGLRNLLTEALDALDESNGSAVKILNGEILSVVVS